MVIGQSGLDNPGDGYYLTTFKEDEQIGKGGFGTVIKVKHKYDGNIYAIKRVAIKEIDNKYQDETLRELVSLAKVRSDFVVLYFNSWCEENYLNIQMEYCSQSLNNILAIKPQIFGRKKGQPLNLCEYFVSYEMLRELLECVQYLHELNPPIIHRDLKPDNILIADKPRTGRFIKLCDFGLATIHEASMSHTKNVGTFRYMAPEMHDSNYTEKADIYSLGFTRKL
ncbi:unnamed protein product [Oppiella nova]|uniref:Protein kinase domain-containing protein n=1 Tax=Oppiella nova TaxID=334625 RepID=A0A7R9QVH1_9ACAR|nr:unnamed protein product [Oppiella nova]CAG2177112.1 unnamed protein product [Oppiella nova]